MTTHKNSYCPIRQHWNGKQYEQAIDSGKGFDFLNMFSKSVKRNELPIAKVISISTAERR